MSESSVVEEPVVEEQPQRTLTREEAYQYLTNTLGRIDSDIFVMIQGAEDEESRRLFGVRFGLLSSMESLSEARRDWSSRQVPAE